jgi:hypothetical protein
MAIVAITGWQVGFDKVACTKVVRAASGLDLADGHRVTGGVLDGRVQRIHVLSDEIARGLVRDLAEIGALAVVIETQEEE